MINRKHIPLFCLLMLVLPLTTKAQLQISQEVLGSTGNSQVLPSGNTIDFTVGEAIVWTYYQPTSPLSVKGLTQGFHQPGSANSSLDANVIFADASCIGANNGSASLNILSATGPVLYYWQAPISDSSANQTNLAPGTYYFHVEDGNFTIDDSVVIGENQTDCADSLDFYNGITPNGDGNNDFWTIPGIELVKDNSVTIFNRWGDLVWATTDYDNITEGKVWTGKSNKGAELPDATYFYVVEVNGKTYKGWIELTH